MRFGGTVVALLTPFDDDGNLSEKSLEGLLEHVLNGGVDGLFVLGTTGLGPVLSLEERKRVLEFVTTTVKRRVFVIAHIGGFNFRDSLELAKHSERVGADAVASLSPLYYKYNTEEIVNYYKTLSEQTGLPLFAYNIPQLTGTNLIPEIVRRIAKEVSRVVGVKDSSADMRQLSSLKALLGGTFVVFNGSEDLVLASLSMGIDGSITALANVIPRLMKEVEEAFKRGDLETALSIQRKVSSIGRLVAPWGIRALYALLEQLGVQVGGPKAPFVPLKDEEKRNLVDEFSRIVGAK